MAIGRSYKPPIAGPRVDLNFGEACPNATVHGSSNSAGVTATGVFAYHPAFIGSGESCKRHRLSWIFFGCNDSISDLKFGGIQLQNIGRAFQNVLPELVC